MTELIKTDAYQTQHTNAFRLELLQSGLMFSAGGDEIPGFSGEFETLVTAAGDFFGRLFADLNAEVIRFPGVISRKVFEKSRYIEGFPQLAGMVHCFCGTSDDHKRVLACIAEGEDWTQYQQQTNAVLTPAACYPIYPLVATRGPIGSAGCIVDTSSYVFRHEPSIDPVRMQMFRQRELVFFGTPPQVAEFIELWLDRVTAGFESLGLDVTTDIANDAFFGRFRKMMVTAQRSERLKTEVLLPISDPARRSASGSCNNHKHHFSIAFGIRLENGELAHTACGGIGIERLVLALCRRHGMVPREWPEDVRRSLRLAA